MRNAPADIRGVFSCAAQSFRCTRMAAKVTTLFARILIAAATTASSCAGSQTVGVGGQSIAITGGLPRFGSISSTRSRALPLMVPPASGVRDDGDAVPPGASRPWGAVRSEYAQVSGC